jgi:hypothetical protein
MNTQLQSNSETRPFANCSASYDLHLYEDSRWKESGLTKLSILLDDDRNESCAGIGNLGDTMQYGRSYRVTLTIEEIDVSPNAESTHSESAPMTSSTHLVDCNSYTGELCEYPTISEALAENRIVGVTKDEDGRFKVCEMCDEGYSIYLTAAQLRVWADELRAMADAPNA